MKTPERLIPSGYVNRKEAAQIIGISASMFDRIAGTEFKHSRIRVGTSNAFCYSKQELEIYRDLRNKRKESGQEELTWKQLVEENERFKRYIGVLSWTLGEPFPKGVSVAGSAANLEETNPEKYQIAKQTLSLFNLDVDELRKKLAVLPNSSTLSRYSPPKLDF